MKIEAGAQVTPNVRLLRPLGEGGMGAVWVAEHLALGTEVAVKFLQGEYAQNEAARARFSREAAASSQVKSAHVVKIYDYGITGDVPFIVMEMLEGTDLGARIAAEKKIPPADVVNIITQLCRALERAHEKGVIHRDIKPENVFLTSEGGDLFVKLLDFGIAKTEPTKLTPSSHRSTMAGESLGTPYYMSPEQFRSAKQIDSRSDLWSVGVLVYEALTGELPFMADTVGALAIIVNEAKAEPPSSIEPSLPPALDAWFAKACARDPADRFASARELSNALRVVFGAVPEASASTSGAMRRVVISQIDESEAGDADRISMRDTAFATAGAETTKSPRRKIVSYVAGGGLAAVALVTATLWATRPKEAPPAAHAAPVDSNVTSATATTPLRAPATATESVAPAASIVTPSATSASHVTPPTPMKSATPAPSASSRGKDKAHERDIW